MSHKAEHVRRIAEELGPPTEWRRYPREDGDDCPPFACAMWRGLKHTDVTLAIDIAAACQDQPHIQTSVVCDRWGVTVYCDLDDAPTEEVPS